MGLRLQIAYYPWDTQGGRLQSTVSAVNQTPTITWQHLGYTYDANGNLSVVQDNVASETLNYSYDALDQLTSVSGAYNQSYSYDAASGNLASLAGQTLSYTDTAHPHAATGLGSQAYSYDANGNMISRQIASGTYTLSYDAEGRLVGIASAGMSASYTYNGDGARVKAVVTTGSQVKTSAYVGNYFEISLGEPRQQSTPTQPDCSTNACIYLPLAATSRPELPAGQAWMSYYSAGGQRVVMRVQSNQAGLEDGVFYFLSDHLGSTSLTLDAEAGKVAELRYSAWGENVLHGWKHTHAAALHRAVGG